MKTYKFFGLLTILVLLAVGLPVTRAEAAANITYTYSDVSLSNWGSGNAPHIWNLTTGDLTLSYTLNLSGVTTPGWAVVEVGLRELGAPNIDPNEKGGWMQSNYINGSSNPNSLNNNDQHLLSKHGWSYQYYDAQDPFTLIAPYWSNNNYGFWFDRDGIDQWQEEMWGMEGVFNTGGVYTIVLKYHALNANTGTIFATINGVQQGLYIGGWKDAQPEFYPAGRSFAGDMSKMQLFWGRGGGGGVVNISNIVASGFPADSQGPVSTNLVATPNLTAINSSVALSALIDDTNTGGWNIGSAEFSLDGGTTWSPMAASDGAFDEITEDVAANLLAPSTPGIYSLCVRGTDVPRNVGVPECIMFVVYDPSGGFVTGGGWIDSPAGAYYPSDLPYFEGSYYEIFFSDEQLNFFEARDVATGMTYDSCGSAHLATITSQGEYETVLGLLNEWPGAVLGGYQDEGVYPPVAGWQWVTGEPFEFETTLNWWLPGEPNDCGPANPDECVPGSEQVLEMYPDGWNDVPFYEPRNLFMVEYEDCDPDITGKATFGFVSKYKKGATVPEGNTEFQFLAGDLKFHGTSYDWLVVNQAGMNAQFKGYGTINDAGNYGFMLWATDGIPDKFRIKIWDAATEVIVYDNGTDQPIGGGSIVVHKAK